MAVHLVGTGPVEVLAAGHVLHVGCGIVCRTPRPVPSGTQLGTSAGASAVAPALFGNVLPVLDVYRGDTLVESLGQGNLQVGMVGHKHTAVARAARARSHGCHVATAQDEARHGVALLTQVGVVAHAQGEVASGSATQHGCIGRGDDGCTVQVDGHAAVGAVASRLAADADVLQVTADDFRGHDVVEDEPSAVAAQVHRGARQDGGVVGCDVDVNVVRAVYLLPLQLAVVYLLNALCVGIDSRLVSLACFVPCATLRGDGRKLRMAALRFVVIHADVGGAFVGTIYAQVFSVLLIY